VGPYEGDTNGMITGIDSGEGVILITLGGGLPDLEAGWEGEFGLDTFDGDFEGEFVVDGTDFGFPLDITIEYEGGFETVKVAEEPEEPEEPEESDESEGSE
jgi:hypothetical protein